MLAEYHEKFQPLSYFSGFSIYEKKNVEGKKIERFSNDMSTIGVFYKVNL